MFVINGMQKELPTGRKLIRPPCRAEWVRCHNILKARVSETNIQHVRSHPRNSNTGLPLEWVELNRSQRLNAIADHLADHCAACLVTWAVRK